MKKLPLTFIIVMLFISYEAQSQIGITGYSIYALGINTHPDKRVSAELKMFANRSYENIMLELDGFFNFKAREYHRFSLGAGINVQPMADDDIFYGFIIPMAVQVFPLKEFKKVSLMFELAPELLANVNDVNIRFLWGIRYSFGN